MIPDPPVVPAHCVRDRASRCHGCLKPGILAVTYHGKKFDRSCKRGVEAMHRSLKSSGGAAAVQANVTLMLDKEDEWRTKMFPFTVDASAEQRADGHRLMIAEGGVTKQQRTSKKRLTSTTI